MTEAEKVKEIIQKDLQSERARSIKAIQELADRETQAAIDRINNVYTSAIAALQKLELADATLFDFFEKTQGNIRIYENVPGHDRAILSLECYGQRLGYDHGDPAIPPIELREGKKYKVIVMVMETKCSS